ncbi:pseudouridine synthase [Belliella kenyensis]|uniref:Pseudouridine synthase n=1 Tax=Belliella kenyensis TaxID=1472724 RepID=A0ABV8ENE5_9BACT|nr:RluA family pseudouridine synthase [Belliella kenyensis]MCH7400474.1 pseudouridine synthase [Belliella kenyensis]MDN3604510.1 pseudouridine synthase [Belliella kenyensis]
MKKFIPFDQEIQTLQLPEKFNFPFYYQPSVISLLAAQKLKEYLSIQKDWKHNFGLDQDDERLAIGKMFGVLVVKNSEGVLGFIAAFSGKLADSNHHSYFVPPVFDMLASDGFFKKEEAVLNDLNSSIESLENDVDFLNKKEKLEEFQKIASQKIAAGRAKVKAAQKIRKAIRTQKVQELNDVQYEILMESQREESLKMQYFQRKLELELATEIERLKSAIYPFEQKLSSLKSERKERSQKLQDRLFDEYQFLNGKGELKSLKQIFLKELDLPIPAAAGECAAPKLLHYAYAHQLTPIAMAEFWWGRSPKSEIRKHGEFYPACRSKCEPILGHMLQGIDVDDNPMLSNPAEGKEFRVIYEDEVLILIDKPAEFLSVPGKNVVDSVQKRISDIHPDAVLVHRLDQSTSGIILVAKTKKAHRQLQAQFIKRTVVKKYIALLEGELKQDSGVINLPLRVDLDNRPRQVVCFEYGKPAETKYEVIDRKNGKTRVVFYPITGRTHQLRVHAAHDSGLGIPIVGDDLYGRKADRLCLHAAYLAFTHPNSEARMVFEVPPAF